MLGADCEWHPPLFPETVYEIGINLNQMSGFYGEWKLVYVEYKLKDMPATCRYILETIQKMEQTNIKTLNKSVVGRNGSLRY